MLWTRWDFYLCLGLLFLLVSTLLLSHSINSNNPYYSDRIFIILAPLDGFVLPQNQKATRMLIYLVALAMISCLYLVLFFFFFMQLIKCAVLDCKLSFFVGITMRDDIWNMQILDCLFLSLVELFLRITTYEVSEHMFEHDVRILCT